MATKYLRWRNSIPILYRDWSNRKDVLDLSTDPLSMGTHEDEKRQEKTNGQTESRKASNLKAGKTPAHGCSPGRIGTLGRFEKGGRT
jgi:hypothetical protein